MAYVAPESRVVGAGELVDRPKKIAINYLRGYFFIDLFAVLPLPQVSYFDLTPPWWFHVSLVLYLIRSCFLKSISPDCTCFVLMAITWTLCCHQLFPLFSQIVILSVLPKVLGASGANYAKNLLRAAILVQYVPRLYRFLPLLAGQSPRGFIFESAWANFVINLLTFVLSGHIVGSFWYLFGLQVGKVYFNVEMFF